MSIPFANAIGNSLLELEENLESLKESHRGVDFASRYVDGAVRYQDSIIHYETIRKRQFQTIWKTVKELSFYDSMDAVLDYGCGKGYLMHLLGETGHFHTIRGIEILPELCRVAESNFSVLGESYQLVCGDARDYSEIDDIDTFVMFNPFPANAMRQIICRLDESVQRRPRSYCIVYINAVYDIMLISLPGIYRASVINNLPRFGSRTVVYYHASL